MTDRIWEELIGDGPLLATAVHDGHHVRDEVFGLMALDEMGRLREEDPFTALWTTMAPTRVIGLRSRFEVDLNRPREKAVYVTPEDAWGLKVWKEELPVSVIEESLAEYDAFFARLKEILDAKVAEYGHFVLFDLHTYNHRRDGADGPEADPAANPQVNVGTGTMNRERWGDVVDCFMTALQSFEFPGGKLDVRENVKFQGGNVPRWVHENYPETGCALAVEYKKFFMDEWTGEPNTTLVEAIGSSLSWTVQSVMDVLATRNTSPANQD